MATPVWPCLTPLVVVAIAAAIVLTVLSPSVWPVLLLDGLYPLALIAAAAGWGAWPTVWLGLGKSAEQTAAPFQGGAGGGLNLSGETPPLPTSPPKGERSVDRPSERRVGQQFCIAAALGMGLLGVLTLILGVAGGLNRPVAWGLVIAGGVLGLIRLHGVAPGNSRWLHRLSARATRPSVTPLGAAPFSWAPLLRCLVLLPLAFPLAVMLFGACLPPGLLWNEEARGYDVLEYHLQVPREWFEAGHITFLPHNVYASFPQQMGMLYLLLMVLVGDPHAAAIPAQLLHAGCAILTVVALAAWTRAGWSRVVVCLAGGSVPWLAYLGCLAYVENSTLFFAAVAAGLMVDQATPQAQHGWRIYLAAGICAGLAAGCKYTAIVLVVATLLLAWLATTQAPVRARLRHGRMFLVGAAAAFSPWLIRNAAFTANPVYPFAYRWFGGAAWSDEQAQQWARGHELPDADRTLAGRTRSAGREVVGSRLFGPALFALAALGLVFGRGRPTLMLLLWAFLIVLAWAITTRMPGRFVVPLVVPLALLAGSALEPASSTAPTARWSTGWRPGAIVAVAVLDAVWNASTLFSLLAEHKQSWVRLTGQSAIPLATMVGRTDILLEADEINNAVPDADAYVWLVGRANVFYVRPRCHYTVAFSRDPWLEFARRNPDPAACVDWLRTQKVTHVVFSWPEIERLCRTYGFAEVVTHEWVERLAASGLRRTHATSAPSGKLASEFLEVAPR